MKGDYRQSCALYRMAILWMILSDPITPNHLYFTFWVFLLTSGIAEYLNFVNRQAVSSVR